MIYCAEMKANMLRVNICNCVCLEVDNGLLMPSE